MIFPPSKAPKEWSSEHAQSLKAVLDSDVMKLALEWVAYRLPKLLDGSDVNKTLVASGEVKGYSNALNEFFSLTVEQPAEVQAPESYPDLDDETKWTEHQPNQP